MARRTAIALALLASVCFGSPTQAGTIRHRIGYAAYVLGVYYPVAFVCLITAFPQTLAQTCNVKIEGALRERALREADEE